MYKENGGTPKPWQKALLSRIADDTTAGDVVLSSQGLEGKGGRVPVAWDGVWGQWEVVSSPQAAR